MTRKKQARNLGKQIRKLTGIKLPLAMVAAKLIVRNRTFDVQFKLPPDVVRAVPFFCGLDCCGTRGHVIVGPKGTFPIGDNVL